MRRDLAIKPVTSGSRKLPPVHARYGTERRNIGDNRWCFATVGFQSVEARPSALLAAFAV